MKDVLNRITILSEIAERHPHAKLKDAHAFDLKFHWGAVEADLGLDRDQLMRFTFFLTVDRPAVRSDLEDIFQEAIEEVDVTFEIRARARSVLTAILQGTCFQSIEVVECRDAYLVVDVTMVKEAPAEEVRAGVESILRKVEYHGISV